MLTGVNSRASDVKINLLEQRITEAGHDTTKARLLNELAWEIKFTDPVRSTALADKAMALARRNNLNKEISNAYKSKAHASLSGNDFFRCIVLYDSAIFYAEKTRDNYLVALCLNKKAGAFGDLGDFDKAIEIYSKGLNMAKRLNNAYLLGVFYNNLADAYQNTGRNTKLVQYYYKLALENSIKSKNWASAGLNSSNLAKEYSANKMLDDAASELNRTKELLQRTESGTYLYATTLKEMASVYDDLGDYNRAGAYAKRAYGILDSLKMPINLLRPLEVLTSVAIKAGNNKDAEIYANEMLQLAIKTHSKVYIKEGYRFLGLISKSKGDYKMAFEYLEQYKSWSDSVFQMDRERNISKVELEAALMKHDLEVKHGLELKNKENKELSENNRALKLVLSITFVLLLLLILLGFWLNKSVHNVRNLNASLAAQNDVVEKQAREKDLLIHEIHHRVKNNLTMMQSLFYLQAKSSDNESVKQVLNESQSRLLSMALVHQHLYDNDAEGALDLVKFFKDLVHDIAETFISDEEKAIALNVSGSEVLVGVKMAVPLGLMLNELITNSLKYAFPKEDGGVIDVTLTQAAGVLTIQYMDNGPGLAADFNFEQSGFGFRILQLLSKQIKAELVHNKVNGFSQFEIHIPL